MNAKKPLLMFTGAGFSKALNPKFPLTDEIYDRIQDKIKNLDYLQHYQSAIGEAAIKDVEILAQRISQHVQHIEQSLPMLKAFIQYSQTEEFQNESLELHGNYIADERDYLKKSMSIGNDALKYIHRDILNHIFKTGIKSKEIKANLEDFIESLKRQCSRLNIFSTNYDTAIRSIQKNPKYYLTDDKKNEVAFNKLFQHNNQNGYCYIPLKGFLDWKLSRDRKIIFQLSEHDADLPNLDSSAVMALNNTSGFGKIPHKYLYDHFREELKKAEYLLFIGYSFRDVAINQAIQEAVDSASIKGLCIVYQESEDTNDFQQTIKQNLFPDYQGNPFIDTGLILHNTDRILGKLFGSFMVSGHQFSDKIQNKSGVYLITISTAEGKRRILYTGESPNVKRSLEERNSELQAEDEPEERQHFAYYCDATDRKIIADKVISAYNPAYNQSEEQENDSD